MGHSLNSSHGKTYLKTNKSPPGLYSADTWLHLPPLCHKSFQKYLTFLLYPHQFCYRLYMATQYYAYHEPKYYYSITWIMFAELCKSTNLPAHSEALSSSAVYISIGCFEHRCRPIKAKIPFSESCVNTLIFLLFCWCLFFLPPKKYHTF